MLAKKRRNAKCYLKHKSFFEKMEKKKEGEEKFHKTVQSFHGLN